MVYEKHIIQTETDNIMKWTAFYGKYRRDYAACLKITSLRKYMKLIPRLVFLRVFTFVIVAV